MVPDKAQDPAHLSKKVRKKFRVYNLRVLKKERRKLLSLMDRLQNYKDMRDEAAMGTRWRQELHRKIRVCEGQVSRQQSVVDELEESIRDYTLPEDAGMGAVLPPKEDED